MQTRVRTCTCTVHPGLPIVIWRWAGRLVGLDGIAVGGELVLPARFLGYQQMVNGHAVRPGGRCSVGAYSCESARRAAGGLVRRCERCGQAVLNCDQLGDLGRNVLDRIIRRVQPFREASKGLTFRSSS